MTRLSILMVLVAASCQVSCQFLPPDLFLKGFGIPFTGLLRHFQSESSCRDPCQTTKCSPGQTCRVVQSQCFQPPCRLVPTCLSDRPQDDEVLLNPCRLNRPVISASGIEIDCADGTMCPLGSRCTRVVYGQGAKCCFAPLGCSAARTYHRTNNRNQISQTTKSRHCPAISAHTTCEKGCLNQADCASGSVCCPTSCGTKACVVIKPEVNHDFLKPRKGIASPRIDEHLKRKVIKGPNGGGDAVARKGNKSGSRRNKGLNPRHGFPHRFNRGKCRNFLKYRTCRNQCSDDSHCKSGKCCPTRCGTNICTYDNGRRYLG